MSAFPSRKNIDAKSMLNMYDYDSESHRPSIYYKRNNVEKRKQCFSVDE